MLDSHVVEGLVHHDREVDLEEEKKRCEKVIEENLAKRVTSGPREYFDEI